MRLPVRRVWRAFPELDRFSDEQCAHYVRSVRRDWRYVGISCLIWFLALLASFVTIATAGGLAIALERSPNFVAMAIAAAGVLLAMVVAFAMPMLAQHTLLRRFLVRRLQQLRCGTCDYSLLGQRVADGRVRCPECGNVVSLSDLGLKSADDLIPPR